MQINESHFVTENSFLVLKITGYCKCNKNIPYLVYIYNNNYLCIRPPPLLMIRRNTCKAIWCIPQDGRFLDASSTILIIKLLDLQIITNAYAIFPFIDVNYVLLDFYTSRYSRFRMQFSISFKPFSCSQWEHAVLLFSLIPSILFWLSNQPISAVVPLFPPRVHLVCVNFLFFFLNLLQ